MSESGQDIKVNKNPVIQKQVDELEKKIVGETPAEANKLARNAVAGKIRISRLKRDVEKLQKESTEDRLTGLLNLNGLIERFQGEIESAKRNGYPLGLVLLDLDNFKTLNDTFGHPKGNVYLRHVAKVLRGIVRPFDIVSRPGGDEFAFVIHDQGNVEQVAERLIEAVGKDPEGSRYWGNNRITASIGTVVLNKITRDERTKEVRDRMFQQADIALYHAKRAGKDNFIVYKEGMTMPEQEHGRFHTPS